MKKKINKQINKNKITEEIIRKKINNYKELVKKKIKFSTEVKAKGLYSFH